MHSQGPTKPGGLDRRHRRRCHCPRETSGGIMQVLALSQLSYWANLFLLCSPFSHSAVLVPATWRNPELETLRGCPTPQSPTWVTFHVMSSALAKANLVLPNDYCNFDHANCILTIFSREDSSARRRESSNWITRNAWLEGHFHPLWGGVLQ